MGFHDFISSAEASTFTGVSPQTLQRFAEAGYLQIEVDSDGMPLFSKSELVDVFGLMTTENADQEQSTPDQLLFDGELHAGKFTQAETAADSAVLHGSDLEYERDEVTQGTISEQLRTDIKIDEDVVPLRREAEVSDEQHTTEESLAQIRDVEYRKLEREVIRLRAVTSLQDQLIDLRETEIKDLKDERQWLRNRIEKLEEKSDRDQLLLLSETQVIRKLITIQYEKRSVLKAALEWLGIATEGPNPANHTIEMNKK